MPVCGSHNEPEELDASLQNAPRNGASYCRLDMVIL